MTSPITFNPPPASPPTPVQAPSYGGGGIGPGGARALPSGPLPSREDMRDMSPTQLHNAFARAYGAPEQPIPAHERPSRATPPAAPAAPTPEDRIAAFDRDMQRAGIQTPPPQPALPVANDPRGFADLQSGIRIPNGQSVDAAAIERANAEFRQAYNRLADEFTKTAGGARAQVERRMIELSAQHQAKLAALMPGADKGPAPAAPAAPAPTIGGKEAPPGWQSHVETDADGSRWVGLDRLTVNDTSGYTIPKFLENQRVNVSTFALLKQAKAAGISQAQVNAVFEAQMRADGWIKS